MKETMNFPFNEIAAQATEHVARGRDIYQKFTCANCGSRQMIDEVNRLYERATCEECHHETNIKEKGCNYMLVIQP